MGSSAEEKQVPAAGSRSAPAIRRSYSDTELKELASAEASFLEAFVTNNGERLDLAPFQRAYLNNRAQFRWVIKARQIGFSYVIALEAFARCCARLNYTAHIVSFSQSEAKEKILTARRAYESLPLSMQKKLVTDSKTELGFAAKGGGGLSRILVHPSKALRGRTGDIYLDELAHYLDDKKVYEGSTPAIMRQGAGAQLTGCSTPLGERGVFWEIAEQKNHRYPDHQRQVVPWWLSSFLCADVNAAARAGAPDAYPRLSTEEMVDRFGKEVIRMQFRGMALEDFEQEFCARFVSDSEAYLPFPLILACCEYDLDLCDDVADLPRPQGRYVAGYDVGRVKDHSVLAVFDEHEGTFTCKMLKTYVREVDLKFHVQEDELRRLLDSVPLARLSIDSTGMGRHLTENLQHDFPNVTSEQFTSDSKERWVTNLKILLQQQKISLPRNRRLVADFHSITRRISASGKAIYDAPRGKAGHADAFWAVALAVQREVQPAALRSGNVTARFIGPPARPEPGSMAWLRSMFPDSPQEADD